MVRPEWEFRAHPAQSDCTFINNTARNRGGALYLRNVGKHGKLGTQLLNLIFSGNSASADGAAAYLENVYRLVAFIFRDLS